jgi:hypothetical protein
VHLEYIDILTSVVKNNGKYLELVQYKNITKELCNDAIKNYPYAIKYVPINMLDENMCIEALKKDPFVYVIIPKTFRTNNVIKTLVDFQITQTMLLMSKDKIDVDTCYDIISIPDVIVSTKFISNNVDNIKAKMSEIIKYHPYILDSLPVSYFSQDDAINAMLINPSMANMFVNVLDEEYGLKAISHGFIEFIDFANITCEKLEQYIKLSKVVINKLPRKYRYDDLYIIAMKEHQLKLGEVPYEYRTIKLIHASMEIELKATNDKTNNEIASEQEQENKEYEYISIDDYEVDESFIQYN